MFSRLPAFFALPPGSIANCRRNLVERVSLLIHRFFFFFFFFFSLPLRLPFFSLFDFNIVLLPASNICTVATLDFTLGLNLLGLCFHLPQFISVLAQSHLFHSHFFFFSSHTDLLFCCCSSCRHLKISLVFLRPNPCPWLCYHLFAISL